MNFWSRTPLQKLLSSKIRSWTDMVPNGEFDEQDVFIIGHPKSGNTWLQNLIAGLVYGIDPEYTPYSLVSDLIPGEKKRYYRRYQTPMFFRNHNLPALPYKKVVYVIRDGRDVMVSYYHHISAVLGREVDFHLVVRGKEVVPPFFFTWSEHVEVWMENRFDADIIVVKYEDLISDSVHQLRRLCDFLSINRTATFLSSIAQKASFEIMRRKEEIHGIDNPNWPEDKHFVRRGEVGSYKDEMPKDVLEIFMESSENTLRKYGYD